MKDKIYEFLTRPYMVLPVLVCATLLSVLDRNYGYFFGLTVVFLILWGSNFRWLEFGIGKRFNFRTVLDGLLIAVALFAVMDMAIQPQLELYFGAVDLSSLEDIRGNIVGFIILSVVVWVFAAFGEELLFHGYYMKWLARMMGNSDKAWLVSAVFISVYFGISHAYQGTAGMIAVGLAGLSHALLFYKFRDRLMMLVFAHGFYDMIGLTLIYLGKERLFVEWFSN